jgi:hypothetical protein
VALMFRIRPDSGIDGLARPLSNPRMQPTGRRGAGLRVGGVLLERAVERRFVWAPA